MSDPLARELDWLASYYKAIDLERLFSFLSMCARTTDTFRDVTMMQQCITAAITVEPTRVEACLNDFLQSVPKERHMTAIVRDVLNAVLATGTDIPDTLRAKYPICRRKVVTSEQLLESKTHLASLTTRQCNSMDDVRENWNFFLMTGHMEYILPIAVVASECKGERKELAAEAAQLLYDQAQYHGRVSQVFSQLSAQMKEKIDAFKHAQAFAQTQALAQTQSQTQQD